MVIGNRSRIAGWFVAILGDFTPSILMACCLDAEDVGARATLVVGLFLESIGVASLLVVVRPSANVVKQHCSRKAVSVFISCIWCLVV